MRILYHHRTMGRGAEGVHIASMVRAFESLGHSVVVLSPPGVDPLRTVGQRPLDKSRSRVTGLSAVWKAISTKAPQFLFEFLEIAYNIWASFRLSKIIKENSIDLLYERCAYFLCAGAHVAKKRGIPYVIEANEVVGVKRARRLRLQRLAAMMEKYSFKRAKTICVVSSFLGRKVEEVVGKEVPVCVTPNAIDPSLIDRVTRRDEIRETLGIADKVVLGFAGWFDWWDRLDLLLDLQKRICGAGYRNVVTLVIGDGPVAKDLQDKSKELGIDEFVIFTGPVERVSVIDYIDSIDVGVLAHSNDFGSPVVLFEMMALAKPIVAPALGPITDVITHGLNGLLFKPLDADRMLHEVMSIINHPECASHLGKKAREIAKERFTWTGNAGRVIDNAFGGERCSSK
jgi:glycosyltransferase involved in cell wall biosynthesis